MIRGISAFIDLPTPVKAAVVVVTGGGALAGLRYLLSPGVFWVVLIGLAVLALMVALYLRLLKWLKKRKAAPMERDLLQSSSATPQGVSEPASVARLDDLRKKFGEGTRKFQQAGKNLYSFPWYMIVGEPGSGKTEAIRHCGVGFPPGLQDELQGTGGTINMNWWFTDHAVMLDTAGRLMFDEVDTGGSQEWKEFLSLMKKYRPRCPVNGLLLVIPADSLIRDSADLIEQKASKIARQLDMIQRTLDVRFPVFVVVTKSDLITGFRDFFDSLQDPQLQHQMLGWSNPAPLDEPYNSGFVDQHIAAVQRRLFRRRLALLNEVLAEEPDPEKPRVADALYAFPQSLARLAPRMTRYLELIFSVGSKWSCKPLFFRGIYFTSSMREGSALDADLAESLGVPVESLPDGRVWERDRAYFLRDVFVKKIFPEKGLVTPATNAAKLHKRRKTAIYISGAAGLILLFFFILYGWRQFNRSIGHLRDYFPPLAALMTQDAPGAAENLQTIRVTGGRCDYVGKSPIEGIKDATIANVSGQLAGAVTEFNERKAAWLFAPAAKFRNRITKDRLNEAQTVIYETAVLKPFLKTTRRLMQARDNGVWTRQDPQVKALRQLIQVEAGKPLGGEDGYSADTFLDVLSEYIFQHDEDTEGSGRASQSYDEYNEDRTDLHKPLGIIYHPTGMATWPAASLQSDPCTPEAALQQGIRRFNDYWRNPVSSPDHAKIKAIEELKNALQDFNDAEQHILALQRNLAGESETPDSAEHVQEFRENWRSRFAKLNKAKESVDACNQTLTAGLTLAQLNTQAADKVIRDVNENYQFLLDEFEGVKEEHFLSDIRKQLETARDDVRNELKKSTLTEQVKMLDADFLAQRDDRRLYEIRFEMYLKANEQLVAEPRVPSLGELETTLEQVGREIEGARLAIDRLSKTGGAAFPWSKEAARVSKYALGAAHQRSRRSMLQTSLQTAPGNVQALEQFIENAANWDWKDIPEEISDKKYDPKAGGAALDDWKRLAEILSPNEKELQKRYADANETYAEYSKRYLEYWLTAVPRRWCESDASLIPRENSWRAQRAALYRMDHTMGVLSPLGKLAESIKRALEAIGQDKANDPRITDFRHDASQLDEKLGFQLKSEHLLEQWRSLNRDAFQARRELLKAPKLIDDYFYFSDYGPPSPQMPKHFARRYWTELTRATMRALANEIQLDAQEALRKLKSQYGDKFPLVKKGTDLDPAGLKTVHSLLESVATWEDETTEGDLQARSELPRELAKLFEPLRKLSLDKNQEMEVKRIHDIAQGLPKAGNQNYFCKITILKGGNQEEGLLNHVTYVKIKQSQVGEVAKRTRSKDDQEVGFFKYPGAPIEVSLYSTLEDYSKGNELERLTFQGHWACLRMLHESAASEIEEGVGYLITLNKNGMPGPLRLRLEFGQKSDGSESITFPGIEKWPSSFE